MHADIHSKVPCHVETVCLLSKLSEAKNHISVKVDMDEMDVTAAESKATYDEIRDWVQENYGFHVTNLKIAQVKRKSVDTSKYLAIRMIKPSPRFFVFPCR